MTKRINHGKIFQDSWSESCKNKTEKVLCHRFRDVFIPVEFRGKIRTPKNPYDFIIFANHHEFPLELKSTDDNKISFSESIIKQHQIDALTDAYGYKEDGVIPGFVFNFRSFDNETWFVHIDDFNKYQYIAENGLKHDYPKLNRRSMPIETVKAIGIKINNHKKRTKYHYHVREFVEEAIKKHGEV